MMNTPSDFQTPAAPGMVNADQRPVDVVVLFSGGLDSILAAKVLEEQGLRVCCLHCHSPFFGDPGAVERWSNLYGLDIRTLDVSDDFCAMLRARPAHGFGKVMNPCVDCKILLLRHVEGLKWQEVADRVGTNENAVKQAYSRFLKKDVTHVTE